MSGFLLSATLAFGCSTSIHFHFLNGIDELQLAAEGLGEALILPVSTVVERHRNDYYEAIYNASRSLDWTLWAKFFIPILTETLRDFLFAMKFIAAKTAYLSTYEPRISERARSVLLRMFQDGPAGVASGLSAAKWMRMTKVSKATATRDLADLAATGAICAVGSGGQVRYRVSLDMEIPVYEPPIDPINDPINRSVYERILANPGINRERLALKVGRSVATVKRAVSVLVAAGKVEHRGSKKTGGYWTTETP